MITLPATLEAFTAYQESLIGRKLSSREEEATAAWLGIFNGVAVGEMEAASVIEEVDRLIGQTTTPAVLHFLRAARYWVTYAEKEDIS